MLRAAWRALSSVRAQAVAQTPGSALRGGGSAYLPSARCGLQTPSEPPSGEQGSWARMEGARHLETGERQWLDAKLRVVARKGVTKWELGAGARSPW